jgi:hypothetical protein
MHGDIRAVSPHTKGQNSLPVIRTIVLDMSWANFDIGRFLRGILLCSALVKASGDGRTIAISDKLRGT